MTMREKLIAKVWECGYPDFPLGPDDTEEMGANWAANIIDAILTTLREPDDAALEAGADFVRMHDHNQDACSGTAERAFAAMIDHIRSGK